MRFPSLAFAYIIVASLILASVVCCQSAVAIGVLYGDPGWAYAYDGNEAFYNDLDGYNPDYINGNDQNNPGGQGGDAALVFPGFTNPNCDINIPGQCKVDNDNGEWEFKSSQWDGSAPGDTLGGVPTGAPPIPPAAPGGVQTYMESNTTYLRVQDPGQPASYGWTDKGAQGGPGLPRQEGNNRKIQFSHDLTSDPAFSGNHDTLDRGITITFRARLSTAATGPIDDYFREGGNTLAATEPWPEEGFGSRVYNDGRGTFHLTQTSALGAEQQIAFSLLNEKVREEENSQEPGSFAVTKTGLVMNNSAIAGGDVDTNFANDQNVNIVEIPNDELDEWQEFWITIQAKDEGNDTHEVNVFYNGELETPETFNIILAEENEFNTGAFLGMGMSSGSAAGGVDIDFYAYSEGVLDPVAASSGADAEPDGDVDGIDFLIIQRDDPSLIPEWQSEYPMGGNPLASNAAVPEPTSLCLVVAAFLISCGRKRSA